MKKVFEVITEAVMGAVIGMGIVFGGAFLIMAVL